MRTRRRVSPDVGISKNTDERSAIADSLRLIQAENLINTDDIVVITPNWVQGKTPETGVVTGTESLIEVIRFAKSNNPRRIVVATGSGEKKTTEIMTSVGFDKIIQAEGVEFIDLNTGPFTDVSLNHDSPSTTRLNKIYEDMTFLISFTQLKMHQEATISAAIKNIALGWPPAEEHGHPKMNCGIHEKLHGFIRSMAEVMPIDLSIVSANPAMIGTGPSGGKPVHSGIVITGTDPVSIDTIGARLLGFKPQAVGYLYDCIHSGIGVGDINAINIKGLPLSQAEEAFSISAYGEAIILDK